MKKCLIISGLIIWGISRALAEPVLCMNFEKDDDITRINGGKNTASYEILEAGAGETIPEGKKYLKVTFSNTVKTNWYTPYINIQLPKSKIPDTASKITMWIKGSSKNKFGPTLVLGDWGWRGFCHYNGSAEIDVSEEEWIKYEFKTTDFLWSKWVTKGESPPSPMRLNEYPNMWIYFSERSFSKSITFCIDDIEIE